MHMSDALISPAVGGAFYVASATLLAVSSAKVAKNQNYLKTIPLMGILGAFVFAAQMINFSIPATGSSGHIGGGLLIAALLGPWATFLIMASILTVQCLFFADGGLLALGCNIFNLGFYPAFIGYPIFKKIAGVGSEVKLSRLLLASIIAVVISLELGAFSVVLQTLLSGRSELPFMAFSGVMLGIHLPISIVEGIITGLVIYWIKASVIEKGIIGEEAAGGSDLKLKGVITMGGIAILVGMVLAWFASPHPDGLEWSIQKITGTEELPAKESSIGTVLAKLQEKLAFMPDYNFAEKSEVAESSKGETGNAALASKEEAQADEKWPAIEFGTSLAGLVGTLITAILAVVLGLVLQKLGAKRQSQSA